MNLRWWESPSNATRITVLSADHAATEIIGCPHMGNFGLFVTLMERNMRSKFGFAAGAVLATTFGFAYLAKAAPLGGFTVAVPAMQMTGETSASGAPPEKAYYHRRYYHRHYHCRHYYVGFGCQG